MHLCAQACACMYPCIHAFSQISVLAAQMLFDCNNHVQSIRPQCTWKENSRVTIAMQCRGQEFFQSSCGKSESTRKSLHIRCTCEHPNIIKDQRKKNPNMECSAPGKVCCYYGTSTAEGDELYKAMLEQGAYLAFAPFPGACLSNAQHHEPSQKKLKPLSFTFALKRPSKQKNIGHLDIPKYALACCCSRSSKCRRQKQHQTPVHCARDGL